MLGSLHWDGAFAEADAEGRGWRPVGLEFGSRTIPVDRTNHCQGVLYLNDCGREAGGFRCCPGFHKEFRQWLANLPPDYEPNESPNLIEKHARELGEALAPRAVTVAALLHHTWGPRLVTVAVPPHSAWGPRPKCAVWNFRNRFAEPPRRAFQNREQNKIGARRALFPRKKAPRECHQTRATGAARGGLMRDSA